MYTQRIRELENVLVKMWNQKEGEEKKIVSRRCKICINSTSILSCTLGRMEEKELMTQGNVVFAYVKLLNARSIFYKWKTMR